MGGISGRQGRFSGLVTEGMSSMGPMMGLAGLRWAWAPAILALVGLVGLALCRDATGKGPACPGLECCTEKERGKIGGHRKEGRKDNDRKEGKKGGKDWREDRNNDHGHSRRFIKYSLWQKQHSSMIMHLDDNTCCTRHTNNKVGKRCQTPDCSKKRNLWWLISDSIDIWTQRKRSWI